MILQVDMVWAYVFGWAKYIMSLDSYETKGAPLTASCFTTTNSSFPLHTLAKTSSAPWPLASKKTSAATEGKGGHSFLDCYVRDLLKLSHARNPEMSRLVNCHVFCKIDLDFWRMNVMLKSNQIAQKIQFEWIFGIQNTKIVCHSGRKNDKNLVTKGWFFMVMNPMVEYVKKRHETNKSLGNEIWHQPKTMPYFLLGNPSKFDQFSTQTKNFKGLLKHPWWFRKVGLDHADGSEIRSYHHLWDQKNPSEILGRMFTLSTVIPWISEPSNVIPKRYSDLQPGFPGKT